MLLPILGVYAAGALLLLFAVHASARAARWAGLGVAFIDVPMVFFAQWVVAAGLAVTGRRGRVFAGHLRAAGAAGRAVARRTPDAAGRAQRRGVRGAAPARGRDPRRRLGRVGRRDRLHRRCRRPSDRPRSHAGGRRRHRTAQARAPGALLLAGGRGAAADPARPARRARRPGADRAVLRHPRLHDDVGDAAARRGRPPAERVLRPHGRADLPARRHARQVHRRRDHGVLRRAAPRRRSRRCTRSTARWRCSTSWRG